MGIKNVILKNRFRNGFIFGVSRIIYEVKVFFKFRIHTDRSILLRKYKRVFGYPLNLSAPQTLNEKLQWLKLYDRKDFYTICADKYAVREYLAGEFGSEYLIPLIYHTDNWKNIKLEHINHYPCIVKANHTSGDYVILRNKDDVNWKELQRKCHWWLKRDYYLVSQEWQYKNIKRQIVVEELLQTKNGRIPNDYKLHYINGELQFVYVSIDREGSNKRNIYDENWRPLNFSWVEKGSHNVRGMEIEPPATFDIMKRIASKVAENFKYVRVDFYDVDGKLYFGEITLYHGSGFDVFVPDEYDLKYGELLNLNE